MGGPKENFRNRPKKSGTKKRQKVRAQKRRLVKAGLDEGVVEKMTTKETREAQKDALKKKLCVVGGK